MNASILEHWDPSRHESFLLCRASIHETIYEDFRGGNETIVCFPIIAGTEQDGMFDIDLPKSMTITYRTSLRSGCLFLRIYNSTLSDASIVVNSCSRFIVVSSLLHCHRPVVKTIGSITVAVVRISTVDSTPKHSVQKLQKQFSGEGINFRTQIDKCSFGQLQVTPVGFYDVTLNQSIADFIGSPTQLLMAAQAHMKHIMIISSVSVLADKILFCFPPGTGSWIASSAPFHSQMRLNSDWCLSLSASMRQFVNLLGLDHASLDESVNASSSLNVGEVNRHSKWPMQCFNGAQSWQLGWYSNRTLHVDPLEDGPQIVKLAAFVDFEMTGFDEPVLVNLSDELILQFNRAKMFNNDTQDWPDRVTVTRLGEYGQINDTGLDVGDEFEVSDFQEHNATLRVSVCSSVVGTPFISPDIMIVVIALDDDFKCDKPTKTTSFPTVPSSSLPPSQMPTVGNSGTSTSAPTVMPTPKRSETPSRTPTPMEPVTFVWRSVKVAAVSGAVSVLAGGIIFCLTKS